MAHLNLELGDDSLDRLRRYAARRRTPVSRLLTDYVDYLLAGGQPIEPPDPSPLTGAHLARLAEAGRAFDWLDDEPDLYSPDHGEPV